MDGPPSLAQNSFGFIFITDFCHPFIPWVLFWCTIRVDRSVEVRDYAAGHVNQAPLVLVVIEMKRNKK